MTPCHDQGPARLMLLALALVLALATAVAAGPAVFVLSVLGLCTGAGARIASRNTPRRRRRR